MDPEKLAKVLAMAESEHHGEALSALRAARIILSRSGMTFRDLAIGVRSQTGSADLPAVITPKSPQADEVELTLRRQITDLECDLAALKRQLDKTNGELEKQKEEADRWRALARETAEKLWDLGKVVERRRVRLASTDKRRAILDHLQNTGSATLSDQEIARRVGASPQVVAHWRRRLATVGRKQRLTPVQPRGRLWQPQGTRLISFEGPRRTV